MKKKRITIDGVEYIRADMVPVQLDSTKERQYTVLSYGMDRNEETIFLRLKGFKSVKFKPGSFIQIKILNQPTNQGDLINEKV